MPNLGVAIWRTILNIKIYASQSVCLNYCYHIYQNLLNFTYEFKYRQKCKVGLTLAGPPCMIYDNIQRDYRER